MVSLTQTEKGEWGPKSMGQKGAETRFGTISVSIDLHANKCLITRGRRDTGGTSQLFFPAQSKQKASTPSESGFQKREKNLDNLWLWEWAKRSTECGLQMLSTWWKNSNGTLRFYIFRPLVLSRSLYSQQLTVRATHPFLCLSHEYKQELKVTQLQLSS